MPKANIVSANFGKLENCFTKRIHETNLLKTDELNRNESMFFSNKYLIKLGVIIFVMSPLLAIIEILLNSWAVQDAVGFLIIRLAIIFVCLSICLFVCVSP